MSFSYISLTYDSMIGTPEFLRNLMEDPPSMGPKLEDGARDPIPAVSGKKTLKHDAPTLPPLSPGSSSRSLRPLSTPRSSFYSEYEPRYMLTCTHSCDTTAHIGVRSVVQFQRLAISFPTNGTNSMIPSQPHSAFYRPLLVVITPKVSALQGSI
jgi:hypothetical protein